jgi:hypothetical protein
MQNRAILRNALRKRNDELPSVSNDMQRSETLRNSLGLNYKSAALNQLSYAGVPIRKLFSASWSRVRHDPSHAPRCKRDQNFTVFFYGTRNGLGLPGGRDRLLQHVKHLTPAFLYDFAGLDHLLSESADRRFAELHFDPQNPR